ncbi:T-cell surface antigen CD2 isoform X2 [Anolis carolinensis]|uniref:T-cell surface antigen CD2 isoform X2 n=1 Tax=Anolis carolinensis TaxID=28377 RepID=UPI002F2B1D36
MHHKLACNTLFLKMNLGTVFLIIFLMAFPFSLKGAEPRNDVICGFLGDSVLLPVPKFTGTLTRLQWNKLLPDNSARLIDRKTTWNNENETRKKYTILNNGSLRIDTLVKEDAGNYTVQGHENKVSLFKTTTVILEVHKPLPQPQIIENCSKKKLICRAETTQNTIAKLFHNDKVMNIQGTTYVNGTQWWTFQQTNLSGKFKCEITSCSSKKQNEKDINCLETASLLLNLNYLMMIGGGVVIFIISLALIVYCVRKKRRERREVEATGDTNQQWHQRESPANRTPDPSCTISQGPSTQPGR